MFLKSSIREMFTQPKIIWEFKSTPKIDYFFNLVVKQEENNHSHPSNASQFKYNDDDDDDSDDDDDGDEDDQNRDFTTLFDTFPL